MLIWILGAAVALYLIICSLAYLHQEKLIFNPNKLPNHYEFSFTGTFKERNIQTNDGYALSGLLFYAPHAKGLIFYLHGNAGALDTWGAIAETYTNLNYDLFIFDYRGFGKSQGKIISEEQFHSDVQAAYDDLKSAYPENKIVIIGYSIGTGPASMLASRNHPKMLILKAPYYSLVDLSKRTYPFLPALALKYKFRTNEFVKKTTAPIVIFHGDTDEVIHHGSSERLKALLKPSDRIIFLKGQGHNGMNENPEYLNELKKILF